MGIRANLFLTAFIAVSFLSCLPTSAQQKRIYLAADDHTDYMWTADEDAYLDAILKMLDYYIDLNDRTASEPYPYQSKWNCDGSYWLYLYSQHRSPEQVERLREQIRQEKITVPRNTMISVMGVAPLEATLRDMYYSGSMEREYGLPFPLALSMEDQVLPLGLSSLWAGSGVQYSWRGVCACVTDVKGLDRRPHEVYWYTGLDGQRVLMKWYSVHPEMITKPNVFRYNLGKYLEADHIPHAIEDLKVLLQDRERYPYDAAAAFGKGGDNLLTLTEDFPRIAREASDGEYQVIVSNEVDFFRDMERNYGKDLPAESLSYGTTEWGTAVASMAELSARVKRAIEKLRTAELMYTLVARKDPAFGNDLAEMRRQAWFACGLYFEHDWTADSPDITRRQRAEWQRRTAETLFAYVDTLYERSLEALSGLIAGEEGSFFVLNPLGWTRTDYCDYPYDGPEGISVVDGRSGEAVPWQFVEKDGRRHIRLLAADIPSMGYRTFKVVSGNGPSEECPFAFSDGLFENEAYRLEINRQGTVTSLKDKRNGRELVRETDGLRVNDLGKAKRTKGIRGEELRVENAGAVSATVVARSYFPLKHTSRITLFRGVDRIEIENVLGENFGNAIQTYAFSFDMDHPTVRTEEAGAILDVRQASQGGHYADSICRLDWVGLQHFADISDTEGGVVLSNRDAYFMKTGRSSVDTLDVATPLLRVMIGGKVNNWLGVEYQDGESRFENSFALLPYRGEYSASRAMKTSLEHLNPLVAGKTSGDGGAYGEAYSLVSVSDPDIFLWSVKPAEEGIGNGVIVRLWNLSESGREYRLNTGWKLEKVTQTTHVETDQAQVRLRKGVFFRKTGPRRLETFRLQ